MKGKVNKMLGEFRTFFPNIWKSSYIAKPTNHVKKLTTTQPHTTGDGPPYWKLIPKSGTIPVNNDIVENAIARHLKSVFTPNIHNNPNRCQTNVRSANSHCFSREEATLLEVHLTQLRNTVKSHCPVATISKNHVHYRVQSYKTQHSISCNDLTIIKAKIPTRTHLH